MPVAVSKPLSETLPLGALILDWKSDEEGTCEDIVWSFVLKIFESREVVVAATIVAVIVACVFERAFCIPAQTSYAPASRAVSLVQAEATQRRAPSPSV